MLVGAKMSLMPIDVVLQLNRSGSSSPLMAMLVSVNSMRRVPHTRDIYTTGSLRWTGTLLRSNDVSWQCQISYKISPRTWA